MLGFIAFNQTFGHTALLAKKEFSLWKKKKLHSKKFTVP